MKKIILASATVILLIFACVPKIEEFLTVSGAADKIDIDDAGTTISLNINASQKPTVSSPVSWIGTSFKTVEKTTYTYDLIVGPNNDTLPRKALVRIASGSLSEFITINQEAKNKKQEDDGKEEVQDTTDTPAVRIYTLKQTGETSVTAEPGTNDLTLTFKTDVPLDSLELDINEEWLVAHLQDSLISLTFEDFCQLEVRKATVTLSSLVGNLKPLTWEITQEPIVITPEGMVEFEDYRFKKAVVDLHDTDGDKEISVPEAEAITELNVSGMGIRSVKGIEPMCNLRKLDISDNDMYAITSEPGAKPVVYDEEKIIKIDLSAPHPYLTEINLDGGVDMDISGCPQVFFTDSDKDVHIRNLTKYKYQSGLWGGVAIRSDNVTEIPDTCRSRDFSRDNEVVRMQTHTRGKGITIEFTILSLTDKDIETDLDDRIAEKVLERLFVFEPMKSYRDCFDVNYIINVAPTRAGNPDYDGWWEAYRHTSLNIMVMPYRTSTANLEKAFVPGTNTESINHEFWGHVFLKIKDEYEVYAGAPSEDFIEDYDGSRYYRNLSFTSDPEQVAWNKFFELPQYHDYVGIFEGGYYQYGMYRSSHSSIMRHGFQWDENLDYFSPWQRYWLFSEIMYKSKLENEIFPEYPDLWQDPEYEDAFFNYFVEQDKKEQERIDSAIKALKYGHQYFEDVKRLDLSWEYKQQFKE